ncbi:MAG: hypothetical protein H6667_04350 [Ardenticatenaceae bacterium]|nr:hypothetical protein [Ardenticatenaceae bacterium]
MELGKQKQDDRLFEWPKQIVIARWIWLPMLLSVVTRLGIALIAYLSVPLINDSTATPPYHLRGTENVLLDVFGSRWDTGFYISIVEEGYKFEGVPLPSVAFFPLLPLLMRGVLPLVGDAAVAGILVSNLALLLAAILFYRLVAEAYDAATADRAVWYLLIFPTAFFGTAIYSESLFLLTAIGAWHSARHGRWGVAAIFAAAAGLTRLVGVIVIPLMLWEWWGQMRGMVDEQRPSLITLPAVFAPLAGLGAFMAYLWRVFGDPLAFVHGAAAWERQPQSIFLTLAELLQRPAGGWGTAVLAGQIHIDNWLDWGLAMLFLVLGLFLLSKKRYGEAAFVLLGVLIPLNSGLLMSLRRYVWVLFPAFILLAQWGKRPSIDKFITTFSLLGLALFTALFANGYWVG